MVFLSTPSPIERELHKPGTILIDLNERRTEGFFCFNIRSQLTPDGYRLLHNVKPNRYVLVTDDNRQQIVAALYLLNLSCSIEGRNPCVQPVFWRDDSESHNRAIAWFGHYVVSEVLRSHTLIIPDNESFATGHRFWESRIGLALSEVGVVIFAPEHGDHGDQVHCKRLRTLYDFFPIWAEFYHTSDKPLYPHKFIILTRSDHDDVPLCPVI